MAESCANSCLEEHEVKTKNLNKAAYHTLVVENFLNYVV